jgi:hypothetical protein
MSSAPNHFANLDHLAAANAFQLFTVLGQACRDGAVEARHADTLVTKALGVVQESGPFAGGLFLLSRTGATDDPTKRRTEHVLAREALACLIMLPKNAAYAKIQPAWPGVLTGRDLSNPGKKKEVIDYLVKMAGVPLEQLLLIKQVWELTLTYARYMARSQRGEDART